MKAYKPTQKPVTPADAERAMFGAKAARTRMLERYGIIREKSGVNAARNRVIERYTTGTARKSPEGPQERRRAAVVKNDLPRAMRALLTMQRIF